MLHHWPEPGIDSHATASRRWWQALTGRELRIVIAHDGIEIFELQRRGVHGGHMPCLQHTYHALAANPEAIMPAEEMWHTLRSIASTYAGQYWHVVVVLSNQYVRWLVLPWQAQIRSREDLQAYYRHGLQQAFGALVADWQIRSHAPGYGTPMLINALPGNVVTQLHTIFKEVRLPVGQVVPAWQLSANQCLSWMRQHASEREGWVICRESHSLTIACLQQGVWQQLRYLPVDSQWCQTLQQVLLREQVKYPERANLPVYLTQPALHGVSTASFAPFKVVEVPSSTKAAMQPLGSVT